jgi:ATP-dependent RNA helicase RhlE
MKFKDYHISPVIKGNLEKLGFKRPTDIQFKAIKPIMDGEDVMAIAQTGTGKTAAFAIPLIDKVSRTPVKERKQISTLVMVPTRELAAQIGRVFEEIGEGTGVRILSLFGGVDQQPQKKAFSEGVDVLIATPGRMFDLMAQKSISLTGVRHLVLDEADLMLDLGFAKDIEGILPHLPKKRQTLFFTATISKHIKKLAYNVVRNAIRIQISPENPVSKNVEHAILSVEMDDKRFFLENMIKEYPDQKFLVFVRTKVRVGRVVEAMKRVGIESEGLHGQVLQDDRFAIIERFRTGENKVLITTDVACRGIDIPGVDCVINYDIPDNPENYVHRCGRTGRGTALGQALSFCSKDELPLVAAIETYTGSPIERYELSIAEYKAIIEDTEEDENDWQRLMKQAGEELGDDWE